MAHAYRFGIEEEYFLSDAATGAAPDDDALKAFHSAAAEAVDPASRELLKSQIEVQVGPLAEAGEARAALGSMRRTLSDLAAAEGLDLVAAGSHPLAQQRRQSTTDKERYHRLHEQYGVIAHRSMCCAMHVHVELPDPGCRIDVMNRILPFLPLFYALSTSSPFWQGEPSGLKGFRLAAYSEWPRMGLPELFADDAAYERFVSRLVAAEAVEDASFLWWLIRPASKFPTLELRICDCCTEADDAVAIAMLYRGLIRALVHRSDLNAGVGALERGVAAENVWQAQRHGLDALFVDAGGGPSRAARDVLADALILAVEHADALGCADQLRHLETQALRGSGADAQLATYREAMASTPNTRAALGTVVARLRERTRA